MTLETPNFALGRKRPRVLFPRLSLSNYLYRSLPPPPVAADYMSIPGAQSIIKDPLGNLTRGNCTIAAAFHVDGVFLANAGESIPSEYTEATAVNLYQALTGGPDTGLDEITVLSCWQTRGLLSDGSGKIQGYAGVNGNDWEEVCQAIYLFENLVLCGELTSDMLTAAQKGDGFIWDQGMGKADPTAGHCFMSAAYTEKGSLGIGTWGLEGGLTEAGLKEYFTTPLQSGLYVVFSQDQIVKASQRAPNGFDATQLLADLQAYQPV